MKVNRTELARFTSGQYVGTRGNFGKFIVVSLVMEGSSDGRNVLSCEKSNLSIKEI